jgi:hypothetical protein
MIDFQDALNRKYDIMQQEVRARARSAGGGLSPELMNQRARRGQNPMTGVGVDYRDTMGQSPAPAAQQGSAQGGASGMTAPDTSTGFLTAPPAPVEPPPASSSTRISDPTMGVTGIGDTYRSNAYTLPAFTTTATSRNRDASDPYRFAKGTARVPGKGDPRRDTVPAKLAPGEAVLNKPAADMAGRGLIAALNKLGAQKMGMV